MNFFNLWDVEIEAQSDDELVMLAYAAQNYDCFLASSIASLKEMLHIKVTRQILNEAFFKTTPHAVFSKFSPGRPYGFVNPAVYSYDLSPAAKANYIRLASMVSNHQRWQCRQFNMPIYIPKEVLEVQVNPNIPKTWVIHGKHNLKMKMEEKYYG